MIPKEYFHPQFPNDSKYCHFLCKEGDLEKLFFLPWVGEFGFYIINHIREVFRIPADNKVVCIKPGHECLFPNARPFYDYKKIEIPDDKVRDRGNRPWMHEQLKLVMEDIVQKYPEYADYSFLNPFAKYHDDPADNRIYDNHYLANFVPKLSKQYNLTTDVVITPRKRNLMPQRNYAKWPEIIDILHKNGLRVGAVGAKQTSMELSCDVAAYEYHDSPMAIEPDIDMLMNTRLMIAINTGMIHLAVFLKRPILYINSFSGCLFFVERQRDKNVYFEKISRDSTPEYVSEKALKYLSKKG